MERTTTQPIDQQVQFLHELLSKLNSNQTIERKISILNDIATVKDYLNKFQSTPFTFFPEYTPEENFAIKSIIVIGQAASVFFTPDNIDEGMLRFRDLLERLCEIDRFYTSIGGIIGYHLTVLKLIIQKNQEYSPSSAIHYIHPEGPSLDQDTPEVRRAVRWGIESMTSMAHIYPVGGAGDRLSLLDELTGTPLPAAMLEFTGITLLEGLIRDVQAQEYLFFKLYNRQILTPIAMMTSEEKNNHDQVIQICMSQHWFNRPSDSFQFFIQPLVPVMTKEGNWSLTEPLRLNLKPGGHGVLWKIAEESGVFRWLSSQKREKILVRQINNPLAGLDRSLLSLVGIGCHDKKSFGFISCERLLNSAEGVNIIIEKKMENERSYEYRLTNIEYTEFAERGIDDLPPESSSPYSIFPANTNILFADIHSIQQALTECPIPGQLINMKSKVPYQDGEGSIYLVEGGRLESTMQNIADYFIDRFSTQLSKEQRRSALKTFIAYNKRLKTISTTKQSYKPNHSPVSTPEQAYYDLLQNGYDLFCHYCGYSLPDLNSIENYLEIGPNFVLFYHPALGPLYSIIRQKIRSGRMAQYAELRLEIAEADIEELDLEGSLLIESKVPLGRKGSDDLICYSNGSSCQLKNVKVKNRGINREAVNCYWRGKIDRHESLKIVLEEGSEFIAQNVIIEGNRLFEVPAYHQMRIEQVIDGGLIVALHKIDRPSWYWKYEFDAEDRIHLTRVNLA